MQFLLAFAAQLGWLRWVVAGIFIAIGVFGGVFFFWQKLKEENYDSWIAFDGLFRTTIVAVLVARISYIIFHWSSFRFGLPLIDIFHYPGLWSFGGLVAAYAMMYRSAVEQKKDVWELWDFFSLLLVWFLGWWWLSRLALGAAAGTSTNLPIGVMFPGRVEPAHPVQIYAAVIYFLLTRYLWWVEPRYRFFLWYRSKKRTARPGFITSVFLIVTGLAGVALGFIQYPFIMVFDFDLNQILSAIMFVAGLILLYVRSGQSFFKKDKGPYVTSFPSANQ